MPLDFEATPLPVSETERNITPDAVNGEVAFDLHKTTLEHEGDWELSQDRATARQNLDDIFRASQERTPEYAAERDAETRAFRPRVLQSYRANAAATGYVNPGIDLKDAA
jgi:hypothetical protein